MEIYEITTIGQSNREAFRGYLPPEVYRQLEPGGEAMALGALRDGWAVGALAFEVLTGSVNILSLAVDSSAGAAHCGADLLQTLVEAIQGNEALYSAYSIFAPESDEVRQTLSIAYLAADFALSVTESKRYVLSLEKLMDSSELASETKTGQLALLSDLPGGGLTLLNTFLRSNPMAYIDIPVIEGDLLTEISVLSFGDDRRPDAALLFNNRTDAGFSLALLLFQDKAAARKGMPMLRLAMEAIQKVFPPETIVTVDGVNDFGNALIGKLAKDAIIGETPVILADWQRTALPSPPSLAEMVFDYLEEEALREGGSVHAH
jgi:hypothetical protein